MAENLMKVPVKGILKNSTSFEGSTTHKCSSSRGTKWDEMNILATHHPPDKDYGHMKIEEPKTPYSYRGEDSGDEGEVCELDTKLLTEKLQVDGEKLHPKLVENATSDDEEEEEEEPPEVKEKRRSFEFKRKAHYNEFMAVKLARQLMQNDEEEDDGDDEKKESSENLKEPSSDAEEEDAVEDIGEIGEACPEDTCNKDADDIVMDSKDSIDNTVHDTQITSL